MSSLIYLSFGNQTHIIILWSYGVYPLTLINVNILLKSLKSYCTIITILTSLESLQKFLYSQLGPEIVNMCD